MRVADAALCTSVNWSHRRGWPNLGRVFISITAHMQHCPQAWTAHMKINVLRGFTFPVKQQTHQIQTILETRGSQKRGKGETSMNETK